MPGSSWTVSPTDINPATYILERQLLWARRKGLRLQGSQGERGRRTYVHEVASNLFEALSADSLREYGAGDGGELGQRDGPPGKMLAVHSSSALSCNLFHYWRRVGRLDVVLKACGLPAGPSPSLEFEAKRPISSKFKYSPNLDALVSYRSKSRWCGIECKFGEPFSARTKNPLKTKYLESWMDDTWLRLPRLRKLGERCSRADAGFTHLDAPQLIKHTLGMSACSGRGSFELFYLFYDVPGTAGALHRTEILEFADAAHGDGVCFVARSYQQVILSLANACGDDHREYVDYMADRYL